MTAGPVPLPAPGVPLADLRELLTIDVAAELRKLCQAQLEGPWQLPAELVRRAIAGGAQQVAVRLDRQIVVSDDGGGLDPGLLQQVAVLIDRERPGEQRHAALAGLEQAGEVPLLALAAVEPLRELKIRTVWRQQAWLLHFRPGHPATVARVGGPAPAGTEVVLRAGGIDGRQAARWLREVGRFASAVVSIDGTPLRDGMSTSLVQGPLVAPLLGRVALLAEGDAAHAYLLAHGVVTAHVTIPDAPSFEAAVELGALAGEQTPTRLREALTPHVPQLIDQAVALIARLAPSLPGGPERQRARVAELALRAARSRLRLQEIERIPLFRAITSAGVRLVDLAELRLTSHHVAGEPALFALSPDQRAGDYLLPPEPTLVADAAERSLLAELLGVSFRTPNLRESSTSLASLARRLLRRSRQLLGGTRDLLHHPFRRPPLPDDRLTPAEQAFLIALREHVRVHTSQGAPEVFLCEGQGPLRRRGGRAPALLLPRDNETVQACLRAYAADRQWLRIIHLALLSTAAGRT